MHFLVNQLLSKSVMAVLNWGVYSAIFLICLSQLIFSGKKQPEQLFGFRHLPKQLVNLTFRKGRRKSRK